MRSRVTAAAALAGRLLLAALFLHEAFSKLAAYSAALAYMQMLWGERRGHGTFGAVQRLPKELPHVATTF